LRVEGAPPIAADMAARTARYGEVAPLAFLGWHPVRREMLIARRAETSTQLYRLAAPAAVLQQLTDFPERVRGGSYQPVRGDFLVVGKDQGGDEAEQLLRLDVDTRTTIALTREDRRHARGPWSHAGDRLLVASLPLDRHGRSENVSTRLDLVDPLAGQAKTLANLPGGGWGSFAWSFDDTRIAAIQSLGNRLARVWLIDAASGEKKLLLPETVGGNPVSYSSVHFCRDGRGLLVVTDGGGEFRQLSYYDLEERRYLPITEKLGWDVDEVRVSHDGRLIAVVVNENGRGTLHLFDAATRGELPLPALPAGSVSELHWHKSLGELGFRIASARSPGEIFSFDPRTGRVESWSRTELAGLDASAYAEPEAIRWKSFDGVPVSGLLYRPPASFQGPRPVLINIHGGPESQSRPGFLGRLNYLVQEEGVALILPNVRGSTGFGRSFQTLDDGPNRQDAVKDIGALLDWIAAQPDLDAKRIMIRGGSYGGYMSLAAAVAYPERIVGSIDIVGIANFVTFLERTESYRRDLRRAEYGDERDPAMRAVFEKISPLSGAARIAKPLLVIQGKNDPRVPYTESEQIVARVRQNNVPVWYLLAEDEGHGFARRPNADFAFYAEVEFMRRYLLAR
jgi:dipeptidyl aminopeptidase/acylaminoacyl peptidase